MRRAVHALVLLALLALAALPPGGAAVEPGAVCVPHPPIRIGENAGPEGYVLLPHVSGAPRVPAYRPGSGVTSGLGTPEDPYVIERLCLLPAWADEPALLIDGADAHVLVRDVQFPAYLPIGVRVSRSAHVTLQGLSFENASIAVEVVSSRDVTVVDSDIRANPWSGAAGVIAFDARGLVVERTTFTGLGYGVDAGGPCVAPRVVGNAFHATARPVRLFSCTGGVVADNEARRPGWAVELQGGARNLVARNVVHEATAGGVMVAASSSNEIEDNVIGALLASGIVLSDSTDTRLERNVLPRAGLSLRGTTEAAYLQRIGEGNTEDGRPIRYVRNVTAQEIVGGDGRLIVASSTAVTIRQQAIGGGGNGILLAYSAYPIVRESAFSDVHAIEVVGGQGARVQDSHFMRSRVSLSATSEVRIEGNDFEGGGGLCTGVAVSGSSRVTIEGNLLRGCATGVEIGPSTRRVIVVRNDIEDNDVGVKMIRGGLGNEHASVEANNITRNGDGVVGTALTRVWANNIWANSRTGVTTSGPTGDYDAKENWWGCAGGPGTAGCDAAGPLVVYSPWLSVRSSAAGRA